MKKIREAGNIRLFRFPLVIAFAMIMANACQPDESQLGLDLLPPGDSISVYVDTLYNLDMQMITPGPLLTSNTIYGASSSRLHLLGSKNDTITGIARADIASQMTLRLNGFLGSNPLIDSVVLSIYVNDIQGDVEDGMRFKVYELTEPLSEDEPYYSDYDITGKYNTTPLVNLYFQPEAASMYNFPIVDNDFLSKLRNAVADHDSLFRIANDSLFKTLFYGFYFTTTQITDGGLMARVLMGSNATRLGIRYLNRDTITEAEATDDLYEWYYISFLPKYAQSVNMFYHDRSTGAVEQYIDNPESASKVSYLAGMGGVNVRISLPPELLDTLALKGTAFNGARLYLPVVPDTTSGIAVEDYASNLMIGNILEDGTVTTEYDYLINPESSSFGKLSRSFDVSAFVDPVYYYSFNISRHIQGIVNGEISPEDSDLLLYIKDPAINVKNMKLWSNHADKKSGPRLELIYSKF